MCAEDACEIDGGLDWARDDEVEGQEDPGVIWGWDADDVDVDGGGRVETGPAIGDCDLEGGEEEAIGSDEAGEYLTLVSAKKKKTKESADKNKKSEQTAGQENQRKNGYRYM